MKNYVFPLALALLATGSFAQGSSGASATASTATGQAQASAAAFRCGGVGDEDQKRIKAEAAQHDLFLTFAAAGGAYLADIDVEITQNGKVLLQGRCNGPLMVADVGGKGSVQIRAVSNGREQRKTVTLAGKPTRVTFTWPQS